MQCRALLALPLDSVSDLVGWRDLGGNQLAVLFLVGHGHLGAGLQAFPSDFSLSASLFSFAGLSVTNCFFLVRLRGSRLGNPAASETASTHLRLSLFNALLAHYQPSIDDFDSLVAIEVLILLRSKSD